MEGEEYQSDPRVRLVKPLQDGKRSRLGPGQGRTCVIGIHSECTPATNEGGADETWPLQVRSTRAFRSLSPGVQAMAQ